MAVRDQGASERKALGVKKVGSIVQIEKQCPGLDVEGSSASSFGVKLYLNLCPPPTPPQFFLTFQTYLFHSTKYYAIYISLSRQQAFLKPMYVVFKIATLVFSLPLNACLLSD